MIGPGDRVCWEEQGGRMFDTGYCGPDGFVVPAGTGIVLAVARGAFPERTAISSDFNKRSYIVRSDESFAEFGRTLVWLADVRPEKHSTGPDERDR